MSIQPTRKTGKRLKDHTDPLLASDPLLAVDVDRSYLAYYRPISLPFTRFTSGHFPADTVTQRHSHPLVTMHGSLQGPLTLCTPSGNHILDAGDFCLIAPDINHYWRNESPHTAVTIAFLIDVDRPGRRPARSGVIEACHDLRRLVHGVHSLHSSGDPDLQQAFWQIADQLTSERPGRMLGITGRLWTFLSLVLDRLEPDRQTIPHDDIAQQIRRLLLNQVNARLTIADVAQALCVSPTHAKQSFRKTYGCGIMTYFNELKIWQAKRLLCDPSMTIDQVSRKLEFSSAAYFSRAFQRHTGQTPTNFRRKRSER